METLKEDITVVGAGLVGSLLAGMLGRRGCRVRVYERRGDMRRATVAAGRSINLAVSVRGIHALRQAGLETTVLEKAIPMRGRMIHPGKGELVLQPYGKDDSECIYSLSRAELNKTLLSFAEGAGEVEIHFQERVTDFDLSSQTLKIRHEETGEERVQAGKRVIGSDGSASALRHAFQRMKGFQNEERLLDYGYKELELPCAKPGNFRLEKNALHIWPRGTFMLIALPNFDGSFTCTLFLPFKGENSFERLEGEPAVDAFFSKHFPDFVALVPDFSHQFFANPTGHMVTVKCAPWNYGGEALLLGDAAHAIVPFFGQGMNCGFEDLTLLFESWDRGGADWNQLFTRFSQSRKPDADAIADMAVENFVEMRDRVGDPRFLLAKEVEKILQIEFPGRYLSRYSLVTFSRVPYRLAKKAGEIGDQILSELCTGLIKADQVDLKRAGQLIQERLSPILESSSQQ